MRSFLFSLGVFLVFLGCVVSVAFWVPKIVNRNRLKEMLGSRFPLVFFIYVANGPMLIFLGLFLVFTFQ